MHTTDIVVGSDIVVDLSDFENLDSVAIEKIKELIEQDILFSNFDEITNISVIEKGKESLSFYDNEISEGVEGVSFFHTINDLTVHVRIS